MKYEIKTYHTVLSNDVQFMSLLMSLSFFPPFFNKIKIEGIKTHNFLCDGYKTGDGEFLIKNIDILPAPLMASEITIKEFYKKLKKMSTDQLLILLDIPLVM